MGEAVYILCALTSVVCASLLGRAYFRRRLRLLLWSSLCFVGLAINNSLLYVDYLIVPQTDLSLLRGLAALFGLAALIYGLVWDAL